jgi:hypothetical protein
MKSGTGVSGVAAPVLPTNFRRESLKSKARRQSILASSARGFIERSACPTYNHQARAPVCGAAYGFAGRAGFAGLRRFCATLPLSCQPPQQIQQLFATVPKGAFGRPTVGVRSALCVDSGA